MAENIPLTVSASLPGTARHVWSCVGDSVPDPDYAFAYSGRGVSVFCYGRLAAFHRCSPHVRRTVARAVRLVRLHEWGGKSKADLDAEFESCCARIGAIPIHG